MSNYKIIYQCDECGETYLKERQAKNCCPVHITKIYECNTCCVVHDSKADANTCCTYEETE